MDIKYKATKLHLGCGPTKETPEGWLNLDGSWNARLAKYPTWKKLLTVLQLLPHGLRDDSWGPDIFIHDLRKPLPFGDRSFSDIYASHVLEHLYPEEGKALLKDCYRVLLPRGVLRMVVPDLKVVVDEYIKKAENNQEGEIIYPADKLSQVFFIQYPSGNIFYKIYALLTDFHTHKWMYDADSLTGYFQWAGFVDVQEMEANQSRITDIGQVESLHMSGLCIEGVKPG